MGRTLLTLLLREGSSEVFVILCTLLTFMLQLYGGLRIKTFAGIGHNFPPCKVHFARILFHTISFSAWNNIFYMKPDFLDLGYFFKINSIHTRQWKFSKTLSFLSTSLKGGDNF